MAQQNNYQQNRGFVPRPGGQARPVGTGPKPGGIPKPAGSFQPRPAQSFNNNNNRQAYNSKTPMVFVNESIKAPNIIIIDETGAIMGTFSRKRAFEIAEERGEDLVQVKYEQETMTSTVKLLDYGKYMYLKQKDEKEKKKTRKTNVLKELKLNYAIGENDLLLKIKKAREMLKDGYNVKFLIKLRGREKIYSDKAIEKLQSVKVSLADVGRPQFEQPKQEVQGYSMVLFNK